MKTLNKRQLLISTLLTGSVVVTALPAYAQSSGDDEIIVTGSLIPKTSNLNSTSPITEIDAIDFETRGVVQVEDMINTLPQAFGAQGSNLSNGATGTSSLNLRGLGATRNLVLLNGRRLPYGSLNTASVDVNFIPSALVSKTDILTGGASATYGSDAISGVVNFTIDDRFEGARLDVNYSLYQHNNDNGYIQDILQGFRNGNPSQYDVPKGSTSDGNTFDIMGILGTAFNDERGHASVYAGYQKTDPILQDARDYSQCALSTRNGGKDFTCAGSSTNQIANLLDLSGQLPFASSVWGRVDPANNAIIARDFTSDTFNYNPYNFYQRPNERFTLGGFANYDINNYVNAYTEVMFMENNTNAQIAPSGVFGLGVLGDSGGINCNNAFFSQQQFDTLCGDIGLTTNDIREDVLILRRNVEGGNRNNDITHTTLRILGGLKGAITDNINYDVYGSFGRVRRSEIYNNDLSKARIVKALNAVVDANGDIVCAVNADSDPTNDDAACVPYDIWSSNGPSQAATDYLASPLLRNGYTEQGIVNATFSGDFGDRFKFGSAEDNIGYAAGVEYRHDTLVSNPDAAFQAGDGAGQGGPTTGIEGQQEAFDVFGELNIPIISDRSAFYDLSTSLAYRHSEYTNNGNDVETKTSSDAYKVAGLWAPTEDFRIRGSYQRAVRAPNIFELFSTQSIGLFDLSPGANGLHDPCSGPTPTATAAQCANTGVSAAQYGNIADNPAGQFNNFTGGNPDLEPEKSDTFTAGFTYQPSWLDGLAMSVDYFDIKVDGFIGNISEELILNKCLDTGETYFCNLVHRGSGGTLWANDTGFIEATDLNTGELSTSGVDISGAYTHDFNRIDGGIKLAYVATWLNDLTTKPLPTSDSTDTYDCVGYYGGQCGSSNPEYRHKADVTFMPGSDKYSLKATWRYYGGVEVSQASNQPALQGSFSEINRKFKAQNYIDLSGTWTPREVVTFRAGVNNVFDKEPPLSSVVGTAPGNGNTYPQVYDSFGRYIFMGATLNFQ